MIGFLMRLVSVFNISVKNVAFRTIRENLRSVLFLIQHILLIILECRGRITVRLNVEK